MTHLHLSNFLDAVNVVLLPAVALDGPATDNEVVDNLQSFVITLGL